MSTIYSLVYTLLIGGLFVFLFILAYDFLYGEKEEKQIRKIYHYFRNETVTKVDLLERQPKKFSLYQVKLNNETKRIKVKPGYKIVKMVPKKK